MVTRSCTHAARHREHVAPVFQGLTGWVADLGCGEGLFADIGEKYLGLDIGTEWLRPLRSRGRSVVAADIHRVPLKDAVCDGVLCMNLLHALDDPARVFSEIDRLLRPGGRAYLKNRWHKGGGEPSGFWGRVSSALHLHHFRFWNHFRHPAGRIFRARNPNGTWGICPRCVARFFAGRGYSIRRRLSGQVFILEKPAAMMGARI